LSSLLSRFAENSLWIARYVERAEHLARILDVNETFARDEQGASNWLPILQLHQDEERFAEHYRTVDAANVVRFYIVDDRNPNSIRCSVRSARENARSIRHLISLETWTQLNVFYNWVAGLNRRHANVNDLSRLCWRIKEGCQLHFGIVNGTLYRDQIWSFYRLGTFIELCDQTTRLVDIKYHSLLPQYDDVGKPIDVAQWNALLRSASGYHGYRRVYPHQMTPRTVAGFILLDPRFPRSIKHCAWQIGHAVEGLLQNLDLEEVTFAPAALGGLSELADWDIDRIIDFGMHEYLDQVQLRLIEISEAIDETFFLSRYSTA
jgi:uncharacterized alpha-E superfamily protein